MFVFILPGRACGVKAACDSRGRAARERDWEAGRTGLPALHPGVVDAEALRLAVLLRVQVETPLVLRLDLLHRHRVRSRIGVLTDPRHLPGDLDERLVRLDAEAAVGNLL